MTAYEKLNLIQTKLKAPKGQFNSFGKYNYRSCEDILEGLKPLLAETKAVINLSDEIVQVGSRVYVKATATFADGESEIISTAYAREPESKKGMDESQVTGTASSYARKYALNGLLAIDDTKDADTMDNRPQQNKAPIQKTAPAQRQNNGPAGGADTPEQTKRINQLLSTKYGDGKPMFSKADCSGITSMRQTKTADEVIMAIHEEIAQRNLAWNNAHPPVNTPAQQEFTPEQEEEINSIF